ncbi:unnamed protein product [Leptosia nina]|uniref:Uncharacterized protein n=1 Tax=Leptosia nina TaxID=320188 RepID=A0AAV1JUQ2_9NEOP
MASLIDRVVFSLLLFVAYSLVVACGDDTKDDNQDRGAHSDRGGVWFGPRLGKRSLRLADENRKTPLLRLLEAADNLMYYYDQLPYELQADVGQDKIIFTPKLGRAVDERLFNENVEFTPRLGRRKIDQGLPTSEQEAQDQMLVNTRPSQFSPRLGRNYDFSPRLGRELAYDVFINVFSFINGYVLLAANLDDFQTIAKKLGSQKFLDEILHLAKDPEFEKYTQKNYKRPRSDNRQKFTQKERKIAFSRQTEPKFSLNERGTRIDFEELVEKVRQRLEKEFQSKHKSNLNKGITQNIKSFSKSNNLHKNKEKNTKFTEDSQYNDNDDETILKHNDAKADYVNDNDRSEASA